MRAIILAGGKGTRLLPYTTTIPKPLVPVGNMAIMEIVIRQLSNCGFDHITVAVNHQAQLIKSYFEGGKRWGIGASGVAGEQADAGHGHGVGEYGSVGPDVSIERIVQVPAVRSALDAHVQGAVAR